jgi:hypothetical protein
MPDRERTPRRSAAIRGFALACALFATAASAASEVMYSWRDPASGQLHLSSVPPPWLRNASTAEQGPRVNVFKDGKVVPPERVGPRGRVLEAPAPGAAQQGAAAKLPGLAEILARRDADLERLVNEALRVGSVSANETFFVLLDRYLEQNALADTVDPAGTGARNAERDRGLQRVKANVERVLREPAARAAFQNEATSWFSNKTDVAAQKIVRCLRDGYC